MASDPTVKKGQDKAGSPSAKDKIDSVLSLAKGIGSCMLVSANEDGKLASRAMIPATTEGLVFSFFFNQDSGKKDDM
jgi:general stress protein 26